MTSKRLVLVALTMCLMTLGACAGDDSGDDVSSEPDTEAAAAPDGFDPEEAELIEALMEAAFGSEEAEAELDDLSPEAREQAINMTRCWSEGMVSVVGVGALAEQGVTVEAVQAGDYEEQLESMEGNEDEMGAWMAGCVDLVGTFRMFGEQDGLAPEVAQCYTEGVMVIDGVEELFRSNLRNNEAEEPTAEQSEAMDVVARECEQID